jgi:hypothetical protein
MCCEKHEFRIDFRLLLGTTRQGCVPGLLLRAQKSNAKLCADEDVVYENRLRLAATFEVMEGLTIYVAMVCHVRLAVAHGRRRFLHFLIGRGAVGMNQGGGKRLKTLERVKGNYALAP